MTRLPADRLINEVSTWEGVSVGTDGGPFGETMTYFHMGRRELGHLHGSELLHLPFPRAVREELIERGEARKHSAGFASHVEVETGTDEGAAHALELLRMSFDRANAAANRHRSRPDSRS